MKYVKKPVVVEAFQFGVDEEPEWFRGKFVYVASRYFVVKDTDGKIETYPESIFKDTYDVYEGEG